MGNPNIPTMPQLPQPVATDPCFVTSAQSPISTGLIESTYFGNGCESTYLRTFTASDNCNPSITASQTVTVVDTTRPTIQVEGDSTGPSFDDFPPDVQLRCTSWEADNTPNGNSELGGLPVVSDDCNTPTLTWGDRVEEELCNSSGNPGIVVVRTFTADDGCVDPPTNRAQRITVAVETDPIVTPPADVSVECDTPNGISPQTTGTASATSDCSLVLGFIDITYEDTQAAEDDCT